MGTWSAFYVRAAAPEVARECEAWLSATHGGDVSKATGAFPEVRRFHLRREAPRRLIVGPATPSSWTEVHLDGFYSPCPTAADVSAHLGTLAVHTTAQTTSDFYEISVYDRGRRVRHLHFEEFAWVSREGEPLAGEPDPLTTREDDLEVFHHADVRAYCEAVFGFEFWREPARSREWTDLQARSRGLLGWLRR